MRDIPPLSVLCLRVVGSKRCSAEDTFARTAVQQDDSVNTDGAAVVQNINDGNSMEQDRTAVSTTTRSTASRLLQSFHKRPCQEGTTTEVVTSITGLALPRTPAIGDGSSRRKQSNDLDLNHPWIAVYQEVGKRKKTDFVASTDATNVTTYDDSIKAEPKRTSLQLLDVPSNPDSQMLVAEYGSSALDLLQSYIDSLVELGRMDDNRLGLHFFQEVKANIELQGTTTRHMVHNHDDVLSLGPPIKKKKTSRSSTPLSMIPSTIGSLSLHNAIFLDETLSNLLQSQVLAHIAVLDLTGVSTLNDDMLQQITQASGPQLQRLSVKNCRRLTNTSITNLATYCPNLISIDIGGAYNITPQGVLDILSPLQSITNQQRGNSLPNLVELHASGLGWNNGHLFTLFSLRGWRGLSVGFSPLISFGGWKDAVWADSSEGMCSRLQSLAVPFCEGLVDNAWLGMMGRHVPHLRALDVRGNTSLNSMTGWYDGRATIVPSVPLQQSLIVLARYSNITKASVEDTKRVHPIAALSLTVILDSGGVGLGILRLDCADTTRSTVTLSKNKRSTMVRSVSTTSSSPVFSACDLDTDKPRSNGHQTSLLSFFSKAPKTNHNIVTPDPIDGIHHIHRDRENEPAVSQRCQSQLLNKSSANEKPLHPSKTTPSNNLAAKYPKKTLTQVYIDCGQSKFGQILCDTCGMLYTPGLPEDEKHHNRFCQVFQKGIPCPNVNVIGKVIERSTKSRLHYTVVLWKGSLLSSNKQIKNGSTSKIPSQWPLLAQIISKDLGMDEVTALQHLREQMIFLYIGKISDRIVNSNITTKSNKDYILGVATVQNITEAFTMSSLHDRSLTPSRAVLGIGILWTHHSVRHQGIATTLVDAARDHAIFGMRVEKTMLAFSSPTQAGYDFAMHYLNVPGKDGSSSRGDGPLGPLVYEM